MGAVLAVVVVLPSGCATRAAVKRLEAHATGLEQALGEVRRAEERLAREMTRLSSEVQALETGIREAQAAGRDAASQTAALRSRIDALEATGGLGTTQPGRAYSRPPTTGSGSADPATTNAERAYAAAVTTFQAREHGQAVLDFLEFMARYPNHPLAGRAQYWIGEAYYAQRDYRQALVEFEKVLERPGPNASAPESLWKIGLCHASLRAPARARETWQRLVRDYPGSDAARRARARLTTRAAPLAR